MFTNSHSGIHEPRKTSGVLLRAAVAVILIYQLSANTFAASNDPINIEADNAKIIEKEGKSVYTGNVLLIQGDTRMNADSVTVYSESGKLTQITATGRPVRATAASTTTPAGCGCRACST